MSFIDNRGFIEKLKETQDVVFIGQEVDWDMEMGAIVRRVCEKNLPAPFFQNIKDYPGWRAFGAPMATYKRLAIAMGLDRNSSIPELAEEYLKRTERPGIKPILIEKSKAPCKENILVGKDVDLFKLPSPMVHAGDGGRYPCTWHMVVSRSLENHEQVNWGMYRQMVVDETTMVGGFYKFSDMGKMFFGEYVPRKKPMPFASAIGCSPMEGLAACAPSPIPEPEFAGKLMERPVELTKCETCDLEVPANAEIIVEGEILPDVLLEEGPFGEYTGYIGGARSLKHACRVTAITYRNNPIITMSNMGVPTDEGQLLRCFSLALEMRKLLESQGIPITGAHMLPESTHHMAVIGVKAAYSNIASQIANLVFGSKLGPWLHIIVVVDEETDIYSKDDLIHALSTRCHPVNGIRVYPNQVGTALYPFATPVERKWDKGAKVLFDCTFPLEWTVAELPIRVKFDSELTYPQYIRDKVLSNWKSYGYED
jgi:phenylphosphate carboxylase alpha subunit